MKLKDITTNVAFGFLTLVVLIAIIAFNFYEASVRPEEHIFFKAKVWVAEQIH